MLSKYKTMHADGKFSKDRAYGFVFRNLLIGSFVAMATILLPVFFIYGLYLLGTLLPDEARETADPTPDSFSYYQQDQRGHSETAALDAGWQFRV